MVKEKFLGMNKALLPILVFLAVMILGIAYYANNYYESSNVQLSPTVSVQEVGSYSVMEPEVKRWKSNGDYELIINALESVKGKEGNFLIPTDTLGDIAINEEYFNSLTPTKQLRTQELLSIQLPGAVQKTKQMIVANQQQGTNVDGGIIETATPGAGGEGDGGVQGQNSGGLESDQGGYNEVVDVSAVCGGVCGFKECEDTIGEEWYESMIDERNDICQEFAEKSLKATSFVPDTNDQEVNQVTSVVPYNNYYGGKSKYTGKMSESLVNSYPSSSLSGEVVCCYKKQKSTQQVDDDLGNDDGQGDSTSSGSGSNTGGTGPEEPAAPTTPAVPATPTTPSEPKEPAEGAGGSVEGGESGSSGQCVVTAEEELAYMKDNSGSLIKTSDGKIIIKEVRKAVCLTETCVSGTCGVVSCEWRGDDTQDTNDDECYCPSCEAGEGKSNNNQVISRLFSGINLGGTEKPAQQAGFFGALGNVMVKEPVINQPVTVGGGETTEEPKDAIAVGGTDDIVNEPIAVGGEGITTATATTTQKVVTSFFSSIYGIKEQTTSISANVNEGGVSPLDTLEKTTTGSSGYFGSAGKEKTKTEKVASGFFTATKTFFSVTFGF